MCGNDGRRGARDGEDGARSWRARADNGHESSETAGRMRDTERACEWHTPLGRRAATLETIEQITIEDGITVSYTISILVLHLEKQKYKMN
jgi:hypothetical protein